jgi:succinoglycan biosynthesis protein ExoM
MAHNDPKNAAADKQQPHISVCICTYKRPALLKRTLESVCAQRTDGLFTYSVVVSDNDKGESGRSTAEEMGSRSQVAVKYSVAAKQGIALARNNAVANATGDLVAFIDDDEFAPNEWLLTLLNAIRRFGVDGVLGPVDPHFDDEAPRWVVKGGFYRRPVLPTGTVLTWKQCRTGNVLLKSELFAGDGQPVDPRCLSGEDQDFFRRKIETGKTFVWCHEAPAREVVPAVRWKRSFLVKRALFRGIFAQRNHGFQPVRVLQALISAPVYAVILPIALFFGQANFMTCVFKLSFHIGRLCGLIGYNPIRGAYVYD